MTTAIPIHRGRLDGSAACGAKGLGTISVSGAPSTITCPKCKRPAPVEDMPGDIESFRNERTERMWPR